jgi:uncharacterized protein
VNNLEWETLERYATTLFNNFWIWNAEENNWILFLIALQEREIRLEVWIWLDTYITDKIAWDILDDYVVPYLKDNKWDEWIKNWYNAVYTKLATYYWINSDVKAKKSVFTSFSNWFKNLWDGLIYIILIPLAIISLIFWRWNWSGWSSGSSSGWSLSRSSGNSGGWGSSRGSGSSRKF